MLRLIRWQIVIALAAMLAVLALLASYALTASATARTLQGSVYVEGAVGEVRQLNPLAQSLDASPAERDIAALVFEGLTRIDAEGRPQPALAERWSPSDDGREWIFVLRSGALWHDGAPVTADDVVFTVGAVQQGALASDPNRGAIWRDVRATRVDERTIRFQLPSAFAAFPALARLPILPAHLLASVPPEQWAAAPFALRPVGTGPLRLVALDAQQAVLEPVGDAPLDYLVLRLYPSTDAALAALDRREVASVAGVALPGQDAPALAAWAQRRALPLAEITLLTLNMRRAPLDTLEFRRALALALNRDLLIENTLGGNARRLDTPVLPGTWAATDAALPAFKRSAAQQELGRLGYTDADGRLQRDGSPLVLPLLIADTPDQAALAAEIARQLDAVGIGVEIKAVPVDELRAALARHDFSLAIHSWTGVGADPDAYALWHSSRAADGANYAGLDDARIDELLARGLQTLDETERRTVYADFQRRWAELIPSLPLYQSVLLYHSDPALADADASLMLDQTRRFNRR